VMLVPDHLYCIQQPIELSPTSLHETQALSGKSLCWVEKFKLCE
jgi:hypothetical protein